ncbi:CynX/NimT family MFS transporter [Halalkalibacterium ligniniphilum]|uniref:CynX/NimT family MFS transporter n=1 Tax=Halalkalibacterium ligniniphilum TaxID=1134413 RepID=UPI00034BC641|nr:MFS transporter [Halalkalibacterium ligniniphilum]
MENQSLTRSSNLEIKRALLLIGIVFVAFNLRSAITAVGPLVSSIRADMGISNGLVGFLTTLPLLSFAVLSFYAPRLGHRFGNEIMVFVALFALTAGIIMRSTGLIFTLFVGTAIIGVGIAIINVLLPGIVKKKYPENVGLITGVYTTSMSIFAALGSGLSIPLAQGLNLGWQKSLLFWSILAVIAIFLWIPHLRQGLKNSKPVPKITNVAGNTLWRSKLAWQVTIFMGFQSFIFYCTIAWLPEILSGSGLNMATAGWMLTIMQLAGLPMTFLTPLFADRFENQRGIVLLIGVLYIGGIIGILVGGSLLLLSLSVILLGLGQGAAISLALTFFGLRSASAQQAAELSGMAQSIGYTLAAVGPILLGFILDITHSGTIPLLILGGAVVIMSLAGLGAGRNRTVYQS